MKLSQTGVGSVANSSRIRPGEAAKLLLQVDAPADGLTSWKLEGRATPDAPWTEVIAANSTDNTTLLDWRPDLRLTVTAGTGTVVAYIGEAVE